MLVNPAEKLYIKLIGFPNIITNKIALRNEIKNVSLKPKSKIEFIIIIFDNPNLTFGIGIGI